MNGVLKKYNVFFLLILSEGSHEEIKCWLNEQIAYILQGPGHIIINAYALNTFSAETIETLLFLEHELLSKNKLLQIIYLPEVLRVASPLLENFKRPDSLALALAAFSNNIIDKKKDEKIHFVKAFIEATIRVIFIQGKTLSRRGKINIKTINREKLSGPISGVIKVASTEFPYEIIISFTEKCYLNLISTMLNEKQTVITNENRDGATEILNIIYGQAKLVLNEQNASISPQIPLLYIGPDYPQDDCNIIFIPFNSDHGEFSIEVRTPKDADNKKFFAQ